MVNASNIIFTDNKVVIERLHWNAFLGGKSECLRQMFLHRPFTCYILIFFSLICMPFTFYFILVSVDMWSVGCIFGEMIRGTVLFPGTDRILLCSL